MLPCALNAGIQLSSGAALRAGRGARSRPNLPRPAPPAPVPAAPESESQPCTPASPRCSPSPPIAHVRKLRAPPLSHLRAARCQRAPRVLATQTSVTPDARSHSERAGTAATGRLCPSRGAGRGQGARDPARSRARQAETHRRTRRSRTDWSCWTLPSPRAPHVAVAQPR